MGGIYAREEGLPEEVWKAIYFHYLPIGVEADAPPTRAQLGKAAVTWAAVSLADKLDTIVGLFAAGEKPTGSRDPYGLRRAAQGVVKILVDLPRADRRRRPARRSAAARRGGASAFAGCRRRAGVDAASASSSPSALRHLLEQRGFDVDEVARGDARGRCDARAAATATRARGAAASSRESAEFEALAALFKRVKNIAKELRRVRRPMPRSRRFARRCTEPAELALLRTSCERAGRASRRRSTGERLSRRAARARASFSRRSTGSSTTCS